MEFLANKFNDSSLQQAQLAKSPICCIKKVGIKRMRYKNATGADTKLKFGMSKLFGTKKKYKKFQIDWVKGRPILTPGIEGGVNNRLFGARACANPRS